ncbi:MAG: aldehyde dehydrogenase family protein [Balneolaceae bacterium]|nr:MAG: aldehyde dehydrogenase family protein [Balneolaceae bacterium]
MTHTEIVDLQKKAFLKGVNRSYDKRKKHLKALKKLVLENEHLLIDALNSDFGKPYSEAYITEIFLLLQEIETQLKYLRTWMKPNQVNPTVTTFPSKNFINKQPYGTVLIIGAWNYPVHLTLLPLAGALAAGNTVVIKPSELTHEVSKLLNRLVKKYFEPDVVTVVEGGPEETAELLEQPFDKFFFTGSPRVGKIVMRAAAEKLIPVTLELGGKSPVIIHEDAPPETTAKRVWLGKCANAGQTCIAPDFILIHEKLEKKFVKESRVALKQFFSDDFIPGENYTRIINHHHFDRLIKLLESSDVIFGGSSNRENRFIEPALIKASWDDEIMQDEIFGPLLPMITYNDVNEVIHELQKRPAPLALYIFSNDEDLQQRVMNEVPFGGGCINEAPFHTFNPALPFGGAGNSGIGSYHGKYSFEAFSRRQSILKKPFWPDTDLRYMPYDDTKLAWFKRLFS